MRTLAHTHFVRWYVLWPQRSETASTITRPRPPAESWPTRRIAALCGLSSCTPMWMWSLWVSTSIVIGRDPACTALPTSSVATSSTSSTELNAGSGDTTPHDDNVWATKWRPALTDRGRHCRVVSARWHTCTVSPAASGRSAIRPSSARFPLGPGACRHRGQWQPRRVWRSQRNARSLSHSPCDLSSDAETVDGRTAGRYPRRTQRKRALPFSGRTA